MGKFTEYAQTQNGQDVVAATLQGVIKKNGKAFDVHNFDAISNALLDVATKELNSGNRTMKLKIALLS